MKVCLLGVLGAVLMSSGAVADVRYTETETVTVWETVTVDTGCGCDCGYDCEKRFVSSQYVKPCKKRALVNQPVRVKTHTEVIDHYQIYQPVTVYKPVGRQIQRRIIK